VLFLALITTKSFGAWGFTPDSTERAYSAPPDLLAVFRGLLLRERRQGKGGRGGGGRAPIEMMPPPPNQILNTPLIVTVIDSDLCTK